LKLSKILLIAVILFFITNLYFLINDFNQLPSPIYGGDTYHQLGHVQHLLSGGSWFEGYNILDESPGYLPLFPLYVAIFAKITGMQAMNALLYSSLLSAILALLIIYFFLKKIFENEYTPVILILLIIPVSRLLIVKYSIFTQLILMPLFYLFMYDFFKNDKKKYLLAVTYGLLGIAHPISFITASLLLVIFTVYFKKLNLQELKPVIIVILIGVIIAQLYWFEPIFVHHIQSSENYLDWNNEDFSSTSLQFTYFKNIIKGAFFNFFSNLPRTLLSLFSLAGLIILFFVKKNNYRLNFLYLFNLSAFLLLFHYFLTRPLLEMDLYPIRIYDMLFYFNIFLLTGLSLSTVINHIKKYQQHILTSSIIILLIFSFNTFQDKKESDQWYTSAKNNLPEKLTELQKFVLENTNVNDVFISANELSFMFNALTGRKVLNTRRAQNSPYVDMDERILASAIILYGNNDETRKNLIKKYNIKYLFWDQDWIPTEYMAENGNIKPFDPLNLFDSETKRKTLEQFNISYQPQYTWVDPALRGDTYKQFNILLIIPNYKSKEQPWIDQLNPFLEEVFNFENKTKIYKVK